MFKITVDKNQTLTAKRGRVAEPNPYTDLVQSYADDKIRLAPIGKTDDGPKEIVKLRKAAKEIGYSVLIEWVGATDAKGTEATGVRFKLVPAIKRPRKAKEADTATA